MLQQRLNSLKTRHHSDVMKERIRQAIMSRPDIMEHIRLINLGKPQSPELRERNRQVQLARVFSPEQKLHMHQIQLGFRHSPESREKCRQASLGHRCTLEQKEKSRQTNLGRSRSLMTREKISRASTISSLKGPDHPNWHGGVTPASIKIRYSSEGNRWVRAVLNRDHHICQRCGSSDARSAHHIKAFSVILREHNILTLEQATACSELWETSNGITLCRPCHRKVHVLLKRLFGNSQGVFKLHRKGVVRSLLGYELL